MPAALEACKDAALVIIGTPVSFQKAHSQITRFCKQVEVRNVGLYCIYINKPGTTLDDLLAICKERVIKVAGTTGFGGLNSGQLKLLDESSYAEYGMKIDKFISSFTN